MERSPENCIDWVTGGDRVGATFGQQKFVNKMRKLAKDYPKDVKVEDNKDGSVFASFPLSWLKINPKRKVSDEFKEAASERFKKMWETKKNERND